MRLLVRVVLLVALLNLLPLAAHPTLSAASTISTSVDLSPPVPLSVPVLLPPPDPKLPVLTLKLQANPATVTVGMTATIALTLQNMSNYAATETHVELPLPDGVTLVSLDQGKPHEILALTSPVPTPDAPIDVTKYPLPITRDDTPHIQLLLNDVSVTGKVTIPPDPKPISMTSGAVYTPIPQVVTLEPDRSQDPSPPVKADPPLLRYVSLYKQLVVSLLFQQTSLKQELHLNLGVVSSSVALMGKFLSRFLLTLIRSP